MIQKLSKGEYFGQTRERYVTPGMSFCESEYLPRTNIPAHRHADAFFYLVTEGHCVDLRGSKRFCGGPSTLVFHPAGETHANSWNFGGRCFHIEIGSARMAVASLLAPLLDDSACSRSGNANRIAWRMYQEFLGQDELSALTLEGLCFELLAEASRRLPTVPADRVQPPWLRRVRESLHDQFSQSFSLGAIAADAGVHPAHLSRAFQQHFGCPVGEYVRKLRVEFACEQLSCSDIPLSMLALDAGFADQSHFSRTFKRYMGVSPASFCKSMRARKSQTS